MKRGRPSYMAKEPRTVDEAEALYLKYGANIISPGYRRLIIDILNSSYSGPISNHTYLDSLFLTDLIRNNFKQRSNTLSTIKVRTADLGRFML